MPSALPKANALTPTSRVETISPKMAEEMLAANSVNRNISINAVNMIASDITAGRWQLNGAPICISVDGLLLDGQHRLSAVVASGIAVPMFVSRGLAADTIQTIDAGRRRTAADVIRMEGVPYYTFVASAATAALRYNADGVSPSRPEVLELVHRNPYLVDLAKDTFPVNVRLNASQLCAVLFIANQRHLYDADVASFVEGVTTGEGLERGDPRLTLREWSISERLRNRGKLPTTLAFSATARAWNAFVRGEELRVIKALRPPYRRTTPIVGYAEQ